MWRMATGTVFDHRRMFEDLGSSVRLVAGQALLVLSLERDLIAPMRVVTARAAHGPFEDRVVRAHAKLRIGVLMASDADRRTLVHFRVCNTRIPGHWGNVYRMTIAAISASLVVHAERPVHQFSVVLVAGRTLGTFWIGDRPLAGLTFGQTQAMANSAGVATLAIAVIVLWPGGCPLDFLVAGDAACPKGCMRYADLRAFLCRLGCHRRRCCGLAWISAHRPRTEHNCNACQRLKPLTRHYHYSP